MEGQKKCNMKGASHRPLKEGHHGGKEGGIPCNKRLHSDSLKALACGGMILSNHPEYHGEDPVTTSMVCSPRLKTLGHARGDTGVGFASMEGSCSAEQRET